MKIHALDELKKDQGFLFDTEFFAQGARIMIEKALNKVISEVRPYVIPLAVCKMLPDFVLPSAIGNSYGDIYET